MSTKSDRDFRPLKHYTPPKGWINDPNGLVYEDGVWHLFAQHYPYGCTWGPMHWIHAKSADLLDWEQLGIALAPDEKLGQIFSGSAIIDEGNTSGLGEGGDPMILMYTSHGEHEQQSIAFSNDRVHFTPYEGNPVIANTELPDFRDPKVFQNSVTGGWSAVIAAGDHVAFYASNDLIRWSKTGEFGREENMLGGVFECPDVFELPTPDGGSCWVLIASMALPREFGGSRTQYFLGRFDGRTFVQSQPFSAPRLIDSGYDNYAAVTFSGAAERCLLGWGTSWNYAAEEPTNEFCGLMTYARRLALVQTLHGLALGSAPITPAFEMGEPLTGERKGPGAQPEAHAQLPEGVFCLDIAAAGAFIAQIYNDAGEAFCFGLDNEHRFFTDRTRAGHLHFSPLFDAGLTAVTFARRLQAGPVSLRLYFDRCIAELFADEGTYANTTLVFPCQPYTHVRLLGEACLRVGSVKA